MTPKKHNPRNASPRKKLSTGMAPGHSPAWRNPRDRMTTFRLKRKQLELPESLDEQARKTRKTDTRTSTDSFPPSSYISPTKALRKRNPFRRSPRKKVRRQALHESQGASQPAGVGFKSYLYADMNESSSRLLDALDEHDSRLEFVHNDTDPSLATDFSVLMNEEENKENNDQIGFNDMSTSSPIIKPKLTSTVPPVDLRPATKLRIVSSDPFPWITSPLPQPPKNSVMVDAFHPRSIEKSNAVQLAARGSFFKSTDTSNLPVDESAMKSELLAAGKYWIFPSVSWISSFPRRGEETRRNIKEKKKDVPSILGCGPQVTDALRNEWRNECFDEVFHAWKAGGSPFFYLCCPNFTVLFLNTKESSSFSIDEQDTLSLSQDSLPQSGSEFKVFITPTTSGFRQRLRDEGRLRTCDKTEDCVDLDIQFETPLKSKSRRTSKDSATGSSVALDQQSSESGFGEVTQSQPPFMFSDMLDQMPKEEDSFENDSESDGELNTSDEGLDFLSQANISPETRAKILRRTKSETQRPGSSLNNSSRSSPGGDEQAKSVVVVSGFSNIQSFYNFLSSDRKLLVSISGPQAGLPPTILSPVPFQGGALKGLKLRACWNPDGPPGEKYSLEFTNGPVLPHCVFRVMQLLRGRDNSRGNYQVSLSGQTAYPGLNACARASETTVADFMDYCSLAASGLRPEDSFENVLGRKLFMNATDMAYSQGNFSCSLK